MKFANLILSIVLFAPGSIALAENNAGTSTKTTDAAGTTVTTDTSSSGSVSSAGIRKSTEDVKTIVDPKGILNETTAKMHSETQVKPNGDYSDSKTIKHADGTLEKVTAEKTTAKNWTDKGKTTTSTHTRSVDPAGLGNKQDAEVKEKIETSPDGTEKKTVTTKENGSVVSEEMKVTR